MPVIYPSKKIRIEDRVVIWSNGFCKGRNTENPRSKNENQQLTNKAHIHRWVRKLNQRTLEGGKRSHNLTIPVSGLIFGAFSLNIFPHKYKYQVEISFDELDDLRWLVSVSRTSQFLYRDGMAQQIFISCSHNNGIK